MVERASRFYRSPPPPPTIWRLYSALGAQAGIKQIARSDRPEVLVDCLVHSESDERVGTCAELPPYRVRVFRLITEAPT